MSWGYQKGTKKQIKGGILDKNVLERLKKEQEKEKAQKEQEKAKVVEPDIKEMSDQELKAAVIGPDKKYPTEDDYKANLDTAKAVGVSERDLLESAYTKQHVDAAIDTEKKLENGHKDFTDSERKEFKLQNQCFLITYMDKFLGHARQTRPGGYGYMTCVDGQDPSLLVSKTASRQNVGSLTNARASDFAHLVPKVRIYKVENGVETQAKFSTFSTSPEDMTKDRGSRGDDVGLVSVSFDFMNQNVALSSRLSDVTLKLVFKSGQDLMKRNSDGFSYLDLFQRGAGDGTTYEQYELKLVVGYEIPRDVKGYNFTSPGFLKEIANLDTVMHLNLKEYDLNFRENGVLELTLNYAAWVEENLNSGRYNIFSNHQQIEEQLNKTDFGEDGEYSGEQLDDDVAERKRIINENYRKNRDAEKKRYKNLNPVQRELAESTEGGVLDTDWGGENIYAAHKKALRDNKAIRDRALKDLETDQDKKGSWKQNQVSKISDYNEKQSKMRMYKAILNTLLYKTQYIDVPMELMVQTRQDLEKIKFVKFLRTSRRTPNAVMDAEIIALNSEKEEHLSVGAAGVGGPTEERAAETEGKTKADTIANYHDRESTGVNYESTDQVVAGLKECNGFKDSWKDLPISEGNNYRLMFFYLGDLIESVITAKDGGPDVGSSQHENPVEPTGVPINNLGPYMQNDKLRLMVGPMTYTHTYPDGGTKPVITNLADVPISLDYFQEWWAENIVSKEVTFMHFHHFLQKVVGGLLVNALGPHCFGDESEVAQFDQLLLSVPPKSDGSSHIPGGATFESHVFDPFGEVKKAITYANARRVHMDSLPKFRAPSEHDRVKDFSNYLYIYIVSQKARTKRGLRAEDEADGIYHFSVGQESGLLKGIQFEKQKIDGAREALVAQSREEGTGQTQGMMIWQPYNASMAMVGNPLLKPGQMIYVDTTSAGMGDPRHANSAARKLGLGGYYTIIKSTNEISPTGWKTDVNGIWQTSGYPLNAEGQAEMLSYAKTAAPAANINMDPSLEYQMAHLVEGGKDGAGDPGSISEAPEHAQTGVGSSGKTTSGYKGSKKKLSPADEKALKKVKDEQELKDMFNQAGIPYETSEEALEKKLKEMGMDWQTEGEAIDEEAKLAAMKEIYADELAEAENNNLMGAGMSMDPDATVVAAQEQEFDVLEAQEENIKKQEMKENQEKALEAMVDAVSGKKVWKTPKKAEGGKCTGPDDEVYMPNAGTLGGYGWVKCSDLDEEDFEE